jgi:phthalate 4,5-dioxygenase oxygenase subunit
VLSKEDNEFACRVGPGTPMGELFRRFWLPAMLPDELPNADCPPVRLRLLGEDLVAFRDSNNKIGVIARDLTPICAGTDLCQTRLTVNGL